ncbi:hypothetical protein JG687_00002395 [Phytophthora cactorum]|uniref:Photolyase/cryptochrome alpha/beta domain-containing protein n=1 Tax=Phytophthora cactorum TaxID=29920 RepID=A0A8T1UUN3_9STRA|nr:hypothetical protein JG687_00002395 [Phytophthora cactorum]
MLVWFRRDLRLHDNLALHAALQLFKRQQEEQDSVANVELIPLYIIHRPQIMRCGANRFQFVLESVADLSNALAERGSKLVVAKGDGIEVLRRLLPAWNITHLFFDRVCEPYAVERDNQALALAKSLGVQTHVTKGYNLYNLEAVIAGHSGKAPKTYQGFLKAVGTQPTPREPLPAPDKLPDSTRKNSELYQLVVNYWKDRVNLDNEEKEDDLDEKTIQIAQIAGPKHDFTLPELTYFGYEPPTKHSFIYGGEQKALEMLKNYCSDEERVALFEKPKTSPAQIPPTPSTTVLSPYMFFGCLSPRTFYHQVRAIQRRRNKMEESPTCLQVNWRYHTVTENEEDMTDDDKLARSQFEAWRDGRTGFPWIDAIMIQLKEEGWMHHLARHSVACFLTRGDLYISWVRGLEVFQERLIDHDWSLNSGNWLWLSSSYFFTAYYRVYSPISFGKKSDPDGLFIKKYIPVLQNFPAKYIYEPWKAPLTLQHAAGCRIGKDYPAPIVEHKAAMKRCVDGMKMSYTNGQYGIPPTTKPTRPSKKRQREDSDDEMKQ